MSNDATGAPDPKEQMRQALERKNAQQRSGEDHTEAARSTGGAAHGPAAGKKQFTRRKAGG